MAKDPETVRQRNAHGRHITHEQRSAAYVIGGRHHTRIRTATIRTLTPPESGDDTEPQEVPLAALVGTQRAQPPRTVPWFLKTRTMLSPHDPGSRSWAPPAELRSYVDTEPPHSVHGSSCHGGQSVDVTKMPFRGRRINTLRSIQTMEYCSTLIRNDL